MQNWKLTLAYDGAEYHGWQVQPGLRTVQGDLQQALQRIVHESPLPQGSGRTDAGVHAKAQVVSFPLTSPIPADNLKRALNRILPASIRVLSAEAVDETFHARHSARSKTYEYRIFRGAVCMRSTWSACRRRRGKLWVSMTFARLQPAIRSCACATQTKMTKPAQL